MFHRLVVDLCSKNCRKLALTKGVTRWEITHDSIEIVRRATSKKYDSIICCRKKRGKHSGRRFERFSFGKDILFIYSMFKIKMRKLLVLLIWYTCNWNIRHDFKDGSNFLRLNHFGFYLFDFNSFFLHLFQFR